MGCSHVLAGASGAMKSPEAAHKEAYLNGDVLRGTWLKHCEIRIGIQNTNDQPQEDVQTIQGSQPASL